MTAKPLILFDMDGTVMDSEPLYARGESRLFAEYGATITEEDWLQFRGSSEAVFYRKAREKYGIDESFELLRDKGRQYVSEEFQKHLAFKAGFVELMSRIENFQRALVTSAPKSSVDAMQKLLPFTHFFHRIFTVDDVQNPKPHPEPYLKACKEMRANPSETIVFEDSINGIRAALAAGCRVFAVAGSAPESELPPVERIVRHFDEVFIDDNWE